MNYQENERELLELFKEVEYIKGTFPPVYLVDGILIVYDKLEKIKVVAKKDQSTQAEDKKRSFWQWLEQLAGKPFVYYNDSNLEERC